MATCIAPLVAAGIPSRLGGALVLRLCATCAFFLPTCAKRIRQAIVAGCHAKKSFEEASSLRRIDVPGFGHWAHIKTLTGPCSLGEKFEQLPLQMAGHHVRSTGLCPDETGSRVDRRAVGKQEEAYENNTR